MLYFFSSSIHSSSICQIGFALHGVLKPRMRRWTMLAIIHGPRKSDRDIALKDCVHGIQQRVAVVEQSLFLVRAFEAESRELSQLGILIAHQGSELGD